jgi:hypothetical protein
LLNAEDVVLISIGQAVVNAFLAKELIILRKIINAYLVLLLKMQTNVHIVDTITIVTLLVSLVKQLPTN